MANNIEFEVEKFIKAEPTKSLLLLIETQVQYIQTIVIGSDGKGVAITPRLEPDGSIHYKD